MATATTPAPAASPPPAGKRAGLEAEAVLGKAYDLQLLRRLARYVRPHAHLLVGWLAFLGFKTALDLAQPLLLAYALQYHIIGGALDKLPLDALGFVGLIVGQNLTLFVQQWLVQLAGQRTMHDLRIAIFDHVLAQRAAFFDRIPVGRLMTRMTNDIESLNEIFSQGAITIIDDVIKAVAIVAIMATKSLWLLAIVATTLPLLVVIIEYARRAMRTSFRQIRVRLAAMNAFAQEHLFGIRVVHLLGRAATAQREYDEINAGHRDAYLLQIRADAAMYALVEAIGFIAVGGVLWWISGHHPATAATVALATMFIDYIGRFFEPIKDLSAKYAVMQGAMAASERIFQLLDTDEADGKVVDPGATLPDYVSWAARVILALNAGAVNVAGHSMGALIATGAGTWSGALIATGAGVWSVPGRGAPAAYVGIAPISTMEGDAKAGAARPGSRSSTQVALRARRAHR